MYIYVCVCVCVCVCGCVCGCIYICVYIYIICLQVMTLQKEGAALQPQLVEARERCAQLVEELKNSERSAEHMKNVISRY
jgi:hypothetical protein